MLKGKSLDVQHFLLKCPHWFATLALWTSSYWPFLLKMSGCRAVVVAQLVEQLPSTPEICGSIQVIGNFYQNKNKEKAGLGWSIFEDVWMFIIGDSGVWIFNIQMIGFRFLTLSPVSNLFFVSPPSLSCCSSSWLPASESTCRLSACGG